MSTYERCAACTIISRNYLAFARTLADSYLKYHPGSTFYVLLVDKKGEEPAEPFTLIGVEELGIENFPSLAFTFDILELNTNVKPSFCKYLFRTQPIDKLFYVDPDISFYHAADPLWERLERHAIVVTPHITQCIPGMKGGELEHIFLRKGVFNLGFIGLSRGAESGAFLDWWEQRCLQLGFSESENGLFVDQKWIDLAPALFPSLSVVHHKGCNMAYWNFHERTLSLSSEGWRVNEQDPLIFFHFSGFAHFRERCTSRCQTLSESALQCVMALYEGYRQRVYAQGHEQSKQAPYSWRCFSNGQPISLLARRLYAAHQNHFLEENPFEATGRFYAWARRRHLFTTSRGLSRYAPIRACYDLMERWGSSIFKTALRLLLFGLGSERYIRSTHAFSELSILRHQHRVWKIGR